MDYVVEYVYSMQAFCRLAFIVSSSHGCLNIPIVNTNKTGKNLHEVLSCVMNAKKMSLGRLLCNPSLLIFWHAGIKHMGLLFKSFILSS